MRYIMCLVSGIYTTLISRRKSNSGVTTEMYLSVFTRKSGDIQQGWKWLVMMKHDIVLWLMTVSFLDVSL